MNGEKLRNNNDKFVVFRPAEAHQKILEELVKSGQYKTRSEAVRHAILELGKTKGIVENTIKIAKKIVPCLLLFLFGLGMLAGTAVAAQNTPKLMGTYSMYFPKIGWSFVSIPQYVFSGSVNVRSVFCNGTMIAPPWDGNCSKVFFYNTSESVWKEWDFNKPDSSNTLLNVTNGFGYWVYVDKVGLTADYSGDYIDPIQESAWSVMAPGWNNMMGWTANYTKMLISNAVPLIYGNWSKNITRVWKYSNKSIDLVGPYWPENASAVFQVYNNGTLEDNDTIAYWDCVADPGWATGEDMCRYLEPPLMPWQNQRPTLGPNSATVSPSTGEAGSTVFTFSINYTDPDNNTASPAFVVIDGVPFTMATTDTDFTDGAIYTYQTTLGWGAHKYYFNFSDGLNHVYYDGTNTTKYPKTVSYDALATLNMTVTDTTPPLQVTGLNGFKRVLWLYYNDPDFGPTKHSQPVLILEWLAAQDAYPPKDSGINHYRIWRNNTNIINVTSIVLEDTTAVQGNTYSYEVSAVDNAGNEGAKSAPVVVTFSIIVPAEITAQPSQAPSSQISGSIVSKIKPKTSPVKIVSSKQTTLPVKQTPIIKQVPAMPATPLTKQTTPTRPWLVRPLFIAFS